MMIMEMKLDNLGRKTKHEGVYQSASSVSTVKQAATGICDIDQLVQNFIDAEDPETVMCPAIDPLKNGHL